MNPRENYSFVIAEDEPRIRKNLVKKILEHDKRFRLTGEVMNGVQALDLMAVEQPDVLFTDIRMPVMDGLKLIEEVYYNFPDVLIVVISGYDDFRYAQKGIQFGVLEYILKPVEVEKLKQTLEKLAGRLEARYNQWEANGTIYSGSPAQESLAIMAADYIRDHFTQDLSVFSLAERFHTNPTYLTRIFKKYLEKTPTRFILELRIRQAKKLMKTLPDMEVKEISYQVGYTDQGYFSRIFKKTTGESPSEYREKQG